jgi:L-gulonate 5-dehydrogenase
MKAIIVEGPKKLSLCEIPVPVLKKGWALVHVRAAAICATDLELFSGHIPAKYPVIPGHEWSGVVEGVADAEDKHWLGKRVVGSNEICCLTCNACRSGLWRNCASFREIGFKADGAYAEYMAVPVYALYELPENISFIQGALIEPLGVAVGTLEKTGAVFGETLLIFGAGSIGLNVLAVARAMGMRRIIVAAKSGKALAIASKMGAYAVAASDETDIKEFAREHHPEKTDVVVDATGSGQCIADSLVIAKRGGKVGLAGYGRGALMNIRIDDIHIENLRVFGAGNNWNMVKRCLDLLGDGIIDTSMLATHIIKYDEYEKGIQMARERPEGFVKAMFVSQ